MQPLKPREIIHNGIIDPHKQLIGIYTRISEVIGEFLYESCHIQEGYTYSV